MIKTTYEIKREELAEESRKFGATCAAEGKSKEEALKIAKPVFDNLAGDDNKALRGIVEFMITWAYN